MAKGKIFKSEGCECCCKAQSNSFIFLLLCSYSLFLSQEMSSTLRSLPPTSWLSLRDAGYDTGDTFTKLGWGRM